MLAGVSSGFVILAVALILGGVGSSAQHPIASNLVAQAYSAQGSRAPLATYNFAGDLGKIALPSGTAALLPLMPWRSAALVLGATGIVAALAIAPLLRHSRAAPPESSLPFENAMADRSVSTRCGFALPLAIGVIDSATRMGFLTFLPFLLKAKGTSVPTVSIALALIFPRGAAGKLVCGLLAGRIGMLATVIATTSATALGIAMLLPLSLRGARDAAGHRRSPEWHIVGALRHCPRVGDSRPAAAPLAFAMRERLGLELCLRHFVGCSATFSAFLPRCCSSQPWSWRPCHWLGT
jgi:predicted MFS family arabinose efflux permease